MKNYCLLYLMFFTVPSFAQVKKSTVSKKTDAAKATVKSLPKTNPAIEPQRSNATVPHPDTIKNSNGTYSTLVTKGNVTTITNSNGVTTELVDMGDEFRLLNPEGNYMPFARNGRSVVVANSDDAKYLFIDNGDSFTVSNLERTSSYVIKNNNVDVDPRPVQISRVKTGNTSKIVNPNGTYTIVTRMGNTFTAKTSYTLTASGNKTTITNPDGTTVITDGEVLPPNGATITTGTSADGSAQVGVSANYSSPKVSRVTATSTITIDGGDTGPAEENLAEKAMANYLPRPNIEYALLTRGGGANASKFGLDLYSSTKDQKKAKDRVQLLINSTGANQLHDGEYHYSSVDPTKAGELNFRGSVKTNNIDVAIAEGTFTVKTEADKLNIEYSFKLDNSKIVTGKYVGKYQLANISLQ